MNLEEELYEMAFDSLSKAECPDFSEYSASRVALAFRKLYGEDTLVYTGSSAKICHEVFRRSEGKVVMIPAKFPTGIKGPNSQFLLWDGKKSTKVAFGPYSTPFRFLD